MGLDSVEILMKVEETFGITIHHHEAEQILTVGDFHNAVWRNLNYKYSSKCKSQTLFYKLRKEFADRLNFSPGNLSLDTPPEEIFPRTKRRQAYLSFADNTNLKLPDLVLTTFWTRTLTIFEIATIIGGLIASLILINVFDFSKWTLLIPVTGIVSSILLSGFLSPKRTKINEMTMREFTQHTLTLNYSTFMKDEGTNRQEMEAVINHIIGDMAGIDLEEITSDKKIGDDLGID